MSGYQRPTLEVLGDLRDVTADSHELLGIDLLGLLKNDDPYDGSR